MFRALQCHGSGMSTMVAAMKAPMGNSICMMDIGKRKVETDMLGLSLYMNTWLRCLLGMLHNGSTMQCDTINVTT
jgi:hypothetical protein